jgi:hypothetical protein
MAPKALDFVTDESPPNCGTMGDCQQIPPQEHLLDQNKGQIQLSNWPFGNQ